MTKESAESKAIKESDVKNTKFVSKNSPKLFSKFFRFVKSKSEISDEDIIELEKIEKGDKLTIIKSYDAFCRIIFVLIIVWTILNVVSIARSQLSNIKENIIVRASIIERSISGTVSMIDDYSNYVGRKILLLGGEQDEKVIEALLKKNFNQHFITKNIYSWLDLDYVGLNGKIKITSTGGILAKGTDVPEAYPIQEAAKDKWVFKIGKIEHIVTPVADYDVIPVALAIYDNDDLKGTLISRIIIDQIQQNIDADLNDKNLSYVVLTTNYEVVARSKENNFDANLLTSGVELRNIIKGFGFNKRNDFLNNNIVIGDATYRYYRQSDYPFLILVGYSNQMITKFFLWELVNVLFQSVGVAILFLSTLYFFKKIKIIPVIQQLIDSRKKSEAANIAKSRFLSNMSHELRTPMSGIVGMSQDLKDSSTLTYEQRDQINTIYRSADALLSILNDIIDFSKIDSKKIELENSNFNLHLLIEDIVWLMARFANDKNLEILSYIDPEIPQILFGDAGKIRQVLLNLTNNAIKFTKVGHVFINVVLQSIEGNKYQISFNVEDSGIGIKEGEIDHLFSRFNQLDVSATRKFDGIGLGLSICDKLATLMGGSVGAKSEFGNGSNFCFSVPLVKSAENDDHHQSTEIEQLKGKKVVVIDKSQISSKVLCSKLKALGISSLYPEVYGYDKTEKDKIDLAASFLRENKNCDVVIVGYSDEFNIMRLLDIIKCDLELRPIPLMLTTSVVDKAKIPPEKLEMFNMILSKPVKECNLTRALFEALEIEHHDEKGMLVDLHNQNQFLKNVKTKKVLLIEDNEVNIKVAVMTLKRLGFQVDVALNGEEGLAKFVSDKYDIVFMDCMMPVMDGYEATRRIRAFEKQKKVVKLVPIVALTADTTVENKEMCFNCGMSDFIAKPIRREVIPIIAKWIDNAV